MPRPLKRGILGASTIILSRVSVQGVKSLGGHFACLCRGFDFCEVYFFFVIIFQKEKGNTFTLLTLNDAGFLEVLFSEK
jgi:hypothetical protein